MKCVYFLFSILCFGLIDASLGCVGEAIACVAPNKKLGVCINIMRCTPLIKRLKKVKLSVPKNLAKFVRDSKCGMDGKVQKVCCVFNNTQHNTKLIEGETLKENVSIEPYIESYVEDRVGETKNQLEDTKRKMMSIHCGIYEEDRIINGKTAGLFEFPWMALLVYNTSKGYDYGCGGTIISDRYILTAAHCIVDDDEKMLLGIRVGEYNTSSTEDCEGTGSLKYCTPGTQDFFHEKTILHPFYNNKTKSSLHDIGLIKLKTAIDMSKSNIMPICLPLDGRQDAAEKANSMTAAGWGITEKGMTSSVLLKVHLPLVSLGECSRRLGIEISPEDNRMCAGGVDSKDTCSGDSGGPLMMPQTIEDGTMRMVQHGITSFGAKSCKGPPGVYTRIAPYIEWIVDEMSYNV